VYISRFSSLFSIHFIFHACRLRKSATTTYETQAAKKYLTYCIIPPQFRYDARSQRTGAGEAHGGVHLDLDFDHTSNAAIAVEQNQALLELLLEHAARLHDAGEARVVRAANALHLGLQLPEACQGAHVVFHGGVKGSCCCISSTAT
jgi:hypothetical protein